MRYPCSHRWRTAGAPLRHSAAYLVHVVVDEAQDLSPMQCRAIVFWIKHTYNRRRRQRALGKLTPVEYELAFTAQDAAVAA